MKKIKHKSNRLPRIPKEASSCDSTLRLNQNLSRLAEIGKILEWRLNAEGGAGMNKRDMQDKLDFVHSQIEFIQAIKNLRGEAYG